VSDGSPADPGGSDAKPGVRHRMRTHPRIGPAYRVAILVVGLTIIAVGVALLVLPGPGWAVIILGLVVLAPDFVWAERTLAPVRRFADAAAERALDPRRRKQNLLIAVALVAVVAALGALYLARYGATVEPLPFL